jgi:peptidoglycan/LPS O-acetylase OafA/YrhL
MASSSGPPKILPLTSVRFLAAFYVMLAHSFPRPSSPALYRRTLQDVIGMGYVSVSFFFILSGFILAIVYLKDKKFLDKKRFFSARFARIYPLYLVAILLDTPHFFHLQFHLFHASSWQTLKEFLATLTLVQTWFHFGRLNPPSWSLSAEAFFYLVFPFVGRALWKMRDRLVLPLFVFLYFVGIWLVWHFAGGQIERQQFYNPALHLFTFVLGILLARIFVWTEKSPEWSHRLETFAPWMFYGSVLAIFAVPAFHLISSELLLHYGVLMPFFALIIVACSSGNAGLNLLFSHRWFVLLGEASYALYLIHYPIYSILRSSVERFGTPMYLLYLVLCVGLSVASYLLLEVPARRWILAKRHVRPVETEITSALAQ